MLKKINLVCLLGISLATHAQRLTIVNENFDDNRLGWFSKPNVTPTDSLTSFLSSGALHLDNKYAGFRLPWYNRSFGMNPTANTSFKAAFSLIDGPQNRGYGLIINPFDGNNYLAFFISGDGYYYIFSAVGGQIKQVTNGWLQSSLLKKGLNQKNTLQIEKVAGNYSFSINDVIVLKQVILGQPFKDMVAFGCVGGVHCAIDDLEIKQWSSKTDVPGKIGNTYGSTLNFPVAPYPSATYNKEPASFYLSTNRGTRYGLKDRDGFRLLDPLYSFISNYNGFTIIQPEDVNARGVLNEQLELIVPYVLNNVNSFSKNGYAACVVQNGFYGLIDKNGKTVLPFLYDFLGNENEGLVYAMLNRKFGVVDLLGNPVVPFGSIGDIDNGSKNYFGSIFRKGFMEARSPTDNKRGIINSKGKWVIEPKYTKITYVDTNKTFIVAIRPSLQQNNLLYGLVDINGKELLPAKYDYLDELGNHFRFGVGSNEDTKDYKDPNAKKEILYGLIDKTGKQIIPAQFYGLNLTNDKDVIEVTKAYVDAQGNFLGDKKGLINVKGQELIPIAKYDPFIYDAARLVGIPKDDNRLKYPFYIEGLMNIALNGKWGAVNKNDKVVVSFEYDFISTFLDGYAVAKKDGVVMYIDKTGKKVDASLIKYPTYGAVKELPPIRK